MEMDVLPNQPVGVDLVMDVVEGCALAGRPFAFREIVSYTRNSDRAAREATKAAIWLGLVQRNKAEYGVPSSVRVQFPATKDKKVLIFREYLQKKSPFVQFATFLVYGEQPAAAASKVCTLYGISTVPETVLRLLSGWGKTTGLFVEDQKGLRLRPEYHVSELPVEYLDGLREALGSDMRARVFIARKLADETFSLVPEPGVTRAVRALRGIGTDPRNSVEDIGELLEDFLRVKAQIHGIPTSSASGVGGVLGILADNGKVTTEHATIGEGINILRVMAAHPTRAESGLRWDIRQDSGLETVLLAMSLMRSIQEYDLTRSTVF